MKYRVEITERALADVTEAYLWIAGDSPINARRWRTGFYEVADSLEFLPFRYGRAPEDNRVDHEIRQKIYKSHRILYTVIDDTVYILHVRHGARRFLTKGEIELPPV